MNSTEIAQAVHAGADLLDHARPGWYRRIDLDLLNLDSCFDCILGQAYGEEFSALSNRPPRINTPYKYALIRLDEADLTPEASTDIDSSWSLDFGWSQDFGFFAGEDDIAAVTAAWKAVILGKLA